MIAEAARIRIAGLQPGLQYHIMNSPNPDTPAEILSGGIKARLVKLGKPIEPRELADDLTKWWPTG